MRFKKLQPFKFFIWFAIASLFALGLWMPKANAQFPNLWNLNSESVKKTSISYVERGNIHIAPIRLDGVPLFKIAAAASDEQNGLRNILPIEWRVNEIETRLVKIVNSDFDPESLQVKVSTLNNQTVIVVSDRKGKITLMTVTELDRQIDTISSSLDDIAEGRADKIKKALLKGKAERQPEYLQQQFYTFLKVFFAAIASSLLIQQSQKLLKKQWRKLNQPPTEETPPTEPVEVPQNRSLLRRSIQRLRSLRLSLPQRRQLNLTLRFIFWWGQITIWLAASITGLLLFPQTRSAGVWLIGVPVSFIAILLGLGIAKKIIDVVIVYCLDRWAEENTLSPNPNKRLVLRIPMISQVLQSITVYLVIVAGIVLFLYAIRAPLTIVLATLGILGLSAQNKIKDWIGGFFILWEDQYALGDVIKINNTTGLVESFDIRTTQLRNLDGELITIPNGSFTTVINFTYQWSRLNLGIDVAYSTDLDLAMATIKDVAEKMRSDSVWGEFILEPATILGVDTFGNNSITIRLLIKTQPGQQWDVGREYRYRLKQAFDLANITIPFPQRSIWFENSPMNN
ncbi:MAG: mechanosensitive ion channel family protein [Spirulina sp.]